MKKTIRSILIPAAILLLCILLPIFAAAEEVPTVGLYAIDQVNAVSGADNHIAIRYTAEKPCFLVTALYDGSGKLVYVDAKPALAGQRQKVTAAMPDQLPDSYEIKAFLLAQNTYEPLCDACTLGQAATGDYNYNILVVDAADGQVTAALSTAEACFLSIEILSEDGETVLDRASLPVEGRLSLDTFSADCELSLPEHYLVRGVLKDAEGRFLCDPAINRNHTAAHEEFAALTEEDFSSDNLLDLVDADDGNFAVLNDDVTKLDVVGRLEGGRWVFDGNLPADLKVGDKVCFPTEEGPYETIEIQSKPNGNALTPNTNTSIGDFYKVIKISASAVNDVPEGAEVVEEMQLMAPSTKEEIAKIKMGPAIAINLPLGPGVTLGGSAKAGVNLDFNYDADRWGKKYFEFVCLSKYEVVVGLNVGANKTWKDTITIATLPFAGLKDVAAISADVELIAELTTKAEYGPKYTYTATAGCVYNSIDGSKTVSEKRIVEGDITLQGEVDASIGIRAGINATLLDDCLKASLGAEGGVGAKYTATATDPAPGTMSYHACNFCCSGKPYGYFEVDFTVDYDINPFLKGSLLDLDFLRAEWTLGEKYYSIINEPESPFKGKWTSGVGTCPNNKYHTAFRTYLDGEQKSGYTISLSSTSGVPFGSFTSPYGLYLYPGEYKAEAIIEDITARKTFTISSSAVGIDLTADHHTLSGYVRDEETGEPLSGATVTATNHTETYGSVTTDANGFYSMVLPEMTYTVSFSCENYKPASSSVKLDQDRSCNANLVLKGAEGTVTGTITDKKTGKPLGLASVSTTLPDGSTVSAPANGEGRYELVLPAGESHALTFSAPDYESTTVNQTVEELQVHTLSVQLEPKLCRITVNVRNADGTPAAGATVTIPGQKRTATADSTGSASFEVLAGIHLITAEIDGYYTSIETAIKDGLTVTLTLQPPSLDCRYDEATETLYIWGNGPMPNYTDSTYTTAPWQGWSSVCKNIVISGLSSIGNYAFYGCKSLTSVTIPASVTTIGSSAFNRCSSLTSVSIPDSVKTIGFYAFYLCTSLTEITVDPDNEKFTSEDGVLFENNKTKTTLVCYPTGKAGSYSIPDGVTGISYDAFAYCTGLTSVTIPGSVKGIGASAFFCCTGLTSVTILDGVTSIGEQAFTSCTGLTSVTIPNSVTKIGSYAFRYCDSLQDLYYNGTAAQWAKVTWGTGVFTFTSGFTIHYLG